jgi:hypothetical protein
MEVYQTINKNASLKNEKSGTNAKPDAKMGQQAQTGTAPGRLGHMVTLHMVYNFLHSAEVRRSHTHEMIQSQILQFFPCYKLVIIIQSVHVFLLQFFCKTV